MLFNASSSEYVITHRKTDFTSDSEEISEHYSHFFQPLQIDYEPYAYRPLPNDPGVPPLEHSNLITDTLRTQIHNHFDNASNSALVNYFIQPLEKCSYFRQTFPSSHNICFYMGIYSFNNITTTIYFPLNPTLDSLQKYPSSAFHSHPIHCSHKVVASNRIPLVLQSSGENISRILPHVSFKAQYFLYHFLYITILSKFLSLLAKATTGNKQNNSPIIIGEEAIKHAVYNNTLSFVLYPHAPQFSVFHDSDSSDSSNNSQTLDNILSTHGIPSLNSSLLFQDCDFTKIFTDFEFPTFDNFLSFIDDSDFTTSSYKDLSYKGRLTNGTKDVLEHLDSLNLKNYLSSTHLPISGSEFFSKFISPSSNTAQPLTRSFFPKPDFTALSDLSTTDTPENVVGPNLYELLNCEYSASSDLIHKSLSKIQKSQMDQIFTYDENDNNDNDTPSLPQPKYSPICPTFFVSSSNTTEAIDPTETTISSENQQLDTNTGSPISRLESLFDPPSLPQKTTPGIQPIGFVKNPETSQLFIDLVKLDALY